jgi:hypothetical protein
MMTYLRGTGVIVLPRISPLKVMAKSPASVLIIAAVSPVVALASS